MESLTVSKLLENEIHKILKKRDFESVTFVVEQPKEENHGDYATNVAFALAKHENKAPIQIAEELAPDFEQISWVEKVEVAKPGFLNFTLTQEFLEQSFSEFSCENGPNVGKSEKICIDSSHPNIAKPLHFGHLRSTILGEALKRMLKYVGYDVLHDNFLGDWGTQFGKLIVAIRKWGNMTDIEKNPLQELVKLYQKFHEESEKNPELETEGAEEFRKIEVEKDAENLKLWRWIVDESLQELQKFYDLMDAHFDVIRGESFYESMLQETLELLEKTKVGVEGEKGALVVHFPEEMKLPTMIFRRADGATLYQTRDLSRIRFYEKEGQDNLLHIVSSQQSLHFRQLFATAELLKLTPKCEHISFGVVRLPEGVMSTRKGNLVQIEDVFAEAETRVRSALEERGVDFPETEKEKLIRMIAIGAIKFNDLSQNRNTTVIFEWEKMLSFDGFSAPFLQYSYARARSILRKSAEEGILPGNKGVITSVAERKLIKKLLDFFDTVVLAAEKRLPNLLTQYVYELAATFNFFYVECPILGAEKEQRQSRLLLTEKFTKTLQKGLQLLAIEVPERM